MAKNLTKIASFNINGIAGRLPILLRWLKEAKPDVVCLQELKTTSDKFPEKAINQAGYEAIWRGQKVWNGVAILSKNTKEKRMRERLSKLQQSLEVAEKSEILSIYGEWGEHMVIPYMVNVSMKNFFVRELKEQIAHLKTILE